jgi:aminomethyltransferase
LGRRRALYEEHVRLGAKIVDFAGWDMPLHYGSQVEEHHAVRRDAGMFDVSHMTIVDLHGDNVRTFLASLLANDVGRLQERGKALYSCMLNEQGGIIDDLIVYFINESFFRVVVNATTREKDLAWLENHAKPFKVTVSERDDQAMIAVQGPNAREKALSVLEPGLASSARNLKPFHATPASVESGGWFVARTGYTGEDGFELMLLGGDAVMLWRSLEKAGVRPCGLGARDTLRLEAGMALYGSDMNEETTPLQSALGWTVAWEPEDRDFMGRGVLEQQRAEGVGSTLVGLLLEGKGVLRDHQKVITSAGEGEITSGSFSPTLGRSIAFARIPADAAGDKVDVEIRGRQLSARIVKPPFVRNGEIRVEL